ncbi:hypothetical protein [Finegoldia magna]|nr:hypothetical protein [Finegoldia magna]MDU1399785.1 hypothetical protein [Finegoldia magna]MDU2897996.1 hypothetical protein [Finegoldia magna]MDU4019504.1 hypothetical protein [Finegoldia magna]MDU5368809.1 hypothetical protein [Finegoldia magna]
MCFRDLEKATEDAKKTFGDENSVNIILEKSYEEYKATKNIWKVL